MSQPANELSRAAHKNATACAFHDAARRLRANKPAVTRPTDDVAGPGFAPRSDMPWATFLAKGWFEQAAPDDLHPGKLNAFLASREYSTLDPHDYEDTCEDSSVVALVDVGEWFAIPVAICARRRQGGGMHWWWRVCPAERRRRRR